MKKDKRIIGKILMVLAVLFFYLPIIFMVIFSFNESKSLTNFTGFSMQWYESLFNNLEMMESLSTTVSLSLIHI